jgi:hypothetical protein
MLFKQAEPLLVLASAAGDTLHARIRALVEMQLAHIKMSENVADKPPWEKCATLWKIMNEMP